MKCKHCKEKFIPKYFLQKYCTNNDACLSAFASHVRDLNKKKAAKDWKQEKKALKEKLKNYKKLLQTKVQLISRLIDKDLPCLARGVNGQMHGGHVFSKGGNTQMRFNLHNIHRQSAYSNNYQNDDGLLRDGLEIEYGLDYLVFIKGLRVYDIPKFSNEEYKEIYLIALGVAKDLKNKGQVYSKSDRVRLRNEINIKLGIYKYIQSVFNIAHINV